ncbi:hypothetical protein FPV16_14915 [Methylobacterium sp. W2]|uniref:hypothetical protein n=1 Tax=Methylobacterium sp. W2 TaxID=2598107 RepID=UPI0039B5B9C1|nr:hypothetical protein [Methylobacterium sp. W2]
MKTFSTISAAVLIVASSFGPALARGGSGGGHSYGGSHSVSGYSRSNGTYVAPAHATNPNGSKSDNWSTRGNTNPYTGAAGTKSPY